MIRNDVDADADAVAINFSKIRIVSNSLEYIIMNYRVSSFIVSTRNPYLPIYQFFFLFSIFFKTIEFRFIYLNDLNPLLLLLSLLLLLLLFLF